MRRARVIGVVGLVIVVAIIAWWKLRGGAESPHATSGEARPSAATNSGATAARAPLAKSSLAGRVVRTDGSAVAGATVAITPKLSVAAMMTGGGPGVSASHETTAMTNDKGEFAFVNIAPMTYMVAATARSIGAGQVEAIAPPGTRVDNLTITLAAGGVVLKGTVTDVLGGPIADAKISAGGSGGFSIRAVTVVQLVTTTDAKGMYELSIPAGDYRVQATHDEYADESKRIELVDVPVTVDFTLTPGALIKGIVVTSDGTPVPDAKVGVGGGPAGLSGDSATTDEKGEFVLRGLEPGALELNASGGDYSSAEPTIVEVGLGQQVEDVRVLVERGLLIAGHVVEKGTIKPIAGVLIGVFAMSGNSALGRDASGADGYFEIRGVRPASYMLFAFGDEMMPEIGKSVVVEDKDVTDVVLEMAKGTTLRGRVEPPQAATLGLSSSATGIGDMFAMIKTATVSGKSDPTTGEFVLEHVPPGSFSVTASTKDGKKGKTDVVVAITDVTGVVVKLEPRASISGRVVDAKGTPQGDVSVAVVPAKADRNDVEFSFDGMSRGTRTKADGSFTVVGLDAGVHKVTVDDDLGAIAWASPADKENPTKPIEITVAALEAKTGVALAVEARDGAIKGVAIGSDGKPAADTWITSSMKTEPNHSRITVGGGGGRSRSFGRSLAPVLSQADGKFTIPRLRKGTYKLVGQSANGAAHGELENVNVGDSVTLKLNRLGEIGGVVKVNGAPVPTYEIVCERDDGDSSRRRITDPKGAYKLERLAPGNYTCSVDADAGLGTGTVTVPAGPATLDINLRAWASVRGRLVSVFTGAPVTNVKILAASTDDKSAGFSRQIEDMLGGKTPVPDSSGAFVITRVSPGAGNVNIMPATGGFAELASRPYTVAEGQTADVGTIKIAPPRDGDAGTLGMTTSDINNALVVDSVADGGPAATAGIKAGDKVVSINGTPIEMITAKLASMALASGTVGVGTRFTLGIDRAGASLQIPVTSVKW